ncbi:MAG: hypothetical protein Q8K48_06110 [Candidatus Planktophila sp.]|nr:hypothetical protein [Candidatus Planktophila sp.]
MSLSELDLGGVWTSLDKSFSAVGVGSLVNDKFEVVVYRDQVPFGEVLNPTLLTLPVLHLENTSVGGSLLDVRNSNTKTNLNGIVALTLESYEFVRGVLVDSRDEAFSDLWSITSAALTPLRQSVWGENVMQISRREFSAGNICITIDPAKSVAISRLESTTRYSHTMTFKTKEQFSIGRFLTEIAQPTIALLEICWQRPIGAEAMHVVFKGKPCEIIATYLQEKGTERNLNAIVPLIYSDQMDWGLWFAFCQEHRNVALLLADLLAGGTGFLQNQMLNICVILADLAKIGKFIPASPGLLDSKWHAARQAAIAAADLSGFKILVSSKLPRNRIAALGAVTNFVMQTVQELGINLPNPESAGRAIIDARNPVAHTSQSIGDFQEMLILLRGATALATIGLFRAVFGDETARETATKLDDQLTELDRVASEIDQRR